MRINLNDLADMADSGWKRMRGMNRSDVLHRMGLEEHTPKSDFASTLGLFAVGLLVGAGLGLLFAPKPGVETRHRLGSAWRERRERLADEIEDTIDRTSDSASRTGASVS